MKYLRPVEPAPDDSDHAWLACRRVGDRDLYLFVNKATDMWTPMRRSLSKYVEVPACDVPKSVRTRALARWACRYGRR